MTIAWIKFEEVAPKKKTRVWLVMPTKCDDLAGALPIGAVAWYGPWRKYSFFPAPGSVFEQDCLRQIAEFCEGQTKAHKTLAQTSPPSVPPEHKLPRAIDQIVKA